MKVLLLLFLTLLPSAAIAECRVTQGEGAHIECRSPNSSLDSPYIPILTLTKPELAMTQDLGNRLSLLTLHESDLFLSMNLLILQAEDHARRAKAAQAKTLEVQAARDRDNGLWQERLDTVSQDEWVKYLIVGSVGIAVGAALTAVMVGLPK